MRQGATRDIVAASLSSARCPMCVASQEAYRTPSRGGNTPTPPEEEAAAAAPAGGRDTPPSPPLAPQAAPAGGPLGPALLRVLSSGELLACTLLPGTQCTFCRALRLTFAPPQASSPLCNCSVGRGAGKRAGHAVVNGLGGAAGRPGGCGRGGLADWRRECGMSCAGPRAAQ